MVVVEDDAFVRTLISTALAAHRIRVVASTPQASGAVVAARTYSPEVALLDLDLGPGPTGFELAIVLRREHPRMGIVFLTSYHDPRLLTGSWDMVPVGSRFLQKSELAETGLLVKTIVQAKSAPLAPQPYALGDGSPLTAHQLRVLRSVVEGKTSKDIAEDLGVTEKAVEAAISRIHKIFDPQSPRGASTRVALVRAFYELTGRTPPRA